MDYFYGILHFSKWDDLGNNYNPIPRSYISHPIFTKRNGGICREFPHSSGTIECGCSVWMRDWINVLLGQIALGRNSEYRVYRLSSLSCCKQRGSFQARCFFINQWEEFKGHQRSESWFSDLSR